MPGNALVAPPAARRFAPEPSLSTRPPRADKDAAWSATEFGAALSMDWSLERLLDRLEGRC